MVDPEVRTESPEPPPHLEPDGFGISLAEIVVILGVVFLLAMVLIPIARNYSSDMRRLDKVQRYRPPSTEIAPAPREQ